MNNLLFLAQRCHDYRINTSSTKQNTINLCSATLRKYTLLINLGPSKEPRIHRIAERRARPERRSFVYSLRPTVKRHLTKQLAFNSYRQGGPFALQGANNNKKIQPSCSAKSPPKALRHYVEKLQEQQCLSTNMLTQRSHSLPAIRTTEIKY